MNAVTQSGITVILTIGCEKITKSRQHSEPIEFEELSRLRVTWERRQRRFANEGAFAFCLRSSVWVSLWTLESEVLSELFSFS